MLALFPHTPRKDRGDAVAKEWLSNMARAGRVLDQIEDPLRAHIASGQLAQHPAAREPATARMLSSLTPGNMEEGFAAWHQSCDILTDGAKTLRTTRADCLSRGR